MCHVHVHIRELRICRRRPRRPPPRSVNDLKAEGAAAVAGALGRMDKMTQLDLGRGGGASACMHCKI